VDCNGHQRQSDLDFVEIGKKSDVSGVAGKEKARYFGLFLEEEMKLIPTLAATIILLIAAAGCSVDQPYEGSMKLNDLSVGMTKTAMLAAMGEPSTTEAIRQGECSEYILRHHSSSYSYGPNGYFILTRGGLVEKFGSGACSSAINSLENDVRNESKKSEASVFDNLSIGMTKQDFLAAVTSTPDSTLRDDRYALECLQYRFGSGQAWSDARFVAFKAGRLVASGHSTCAAEATDANFLPDGKYHYLLLK
jgi:hypothetical protein